MREAVRISNSQKSARKPSDSKKAPSPGYNAPSGCFGFANTQKKSDTKKETRAKTLSVKRTYNEWIFLCAGLCLCFLLLLTSGDSIRSISESDGIGALSASLKHIMTENDSVAVFFGFDLSDKEEAPDTQQEQQVQAESIPVFTYGEGLSVDEYIDKYNTVNYNYTGEIPVFGVVSSRYSFRKNPFFGKYEGEDEYEFHSGIDIAADHGTEIVSYLAGTVEKCALSASYGYYVCIDHGNGLKTMYAHASKLLCKEGDEVERGQVIALVGDTGRATGAHLHFEVYENGQTVNPEKYLGALFE